MWNVFFLDDVGCFDASTTFHCVHDMKNTGLN